MSKKCNCNDGFSSSEYSRLAGKISAIHKYLDDTGIQSNKDVNKRVKLISLLYQESLIENKRLKLMIEMNA